MAVGIATVVGLGLLWAALPHGDVPRPVTEIATPPTEPVPAAVDRSDANLKADAAPKAEPAVVVAEKTKTELPSPPTTSATDRPGESATVAKARKAEAVVAVQEKPADTAFPKTFTECTACPEMVKIPAGRFFMGSPPDETGRSDDEGPQRWVEVDAFALGKTEVSFEQWDACVQGGACRKAEAGWGRGPMPVITVSWQDTQAYLAWLLTKTGHIYRLPSEAEWEYAARDGTTTRYPWGDEVGKNKANCRGCGGQWDGRQTAPVRSFDPNRFGLHNMAGNVREWVEDCWHDTYKGAPARGQPAWTSGDCRLRVVRGGSWVNYPDDVRSAYRNRIDAGGRNDLTGFRVARTLP